MSQALHDIVDGSLSDRRGANLERSHEWPKFLSDLHVQAAIKITPL